MLPFRMGSTRKVGVVVRLAEASGRDILSGVFGYLRTGARWEMKVFQTSDEMTPEAFRDLERRGCSGLIMTGPGRPETDRLVLCSGMPVAFVGDPGPVLRARKTAAAYIRNDDDAIGAAGARYLMSLGRHGAYGFVRDFARPYWSEDRCRGFRRELAARKAPCEVYTPTAANGTPEESVALAAWLKALPKPCAVMAGWDVRAIQVLQQCAAAGLAVPGQVSVLGVDNDELLDESSRPPLSSIQPDHEQIGFAAARTLDRLMSARRRKRGTDIVLIERHKRLVERDSTAAVSPAAHLIMRANAFIARNAAYGIGVKDVVAHLGVSRRLADLRFRQFAGGTILEAIVKARLDEVKRLLETTDRTIKSVSIACGYTDLPYLKTLFRRRFGMTMSEWRRRAAAVTSRAGA